MKDNPDDKRPQGKPSERIPGRLLRYENTDYVEFVPSVRREEEVRSVIRQHRGVSYYQNKGDKNSYSLHVNVPGDTLDPASEILSRVQEALKPECKKVPVLPTARFLYDTESMKVWYRREKKELCVMIVIADSADARVMTGDFYDKSVELMKLISNKKYK